MRRWPLAGIAGGVAGTLLATLLGAAPASASVILNNCNVGGAGNGSMCYFYRSSYNGAEEGVASRDPDLSTNPAVYFSYNNQYTGSSTGANQPVWNDAGSGQNGRIDCAAHIFYHASYQGTEVTLAAWHTDPSWQNSTLGADNNNNRSQDFC